MSPATAAAAPVVKTTARAFGLKSIADSVASALEDRFARMLPQLEVQVVGFRGAFTGRLWWVASYTVGAELRIVRADLSARELGDATGEAHTRRADAERAAAAVQRTFAAVQEAPCSLN